MGSGKTVKAIRLLKGLTQAGMAAKLKITQQAYSKIEHQEWVPQKKIQGILAILNISKEYMAVIRQLV